MEKIKRLVLGLIPNQQCNLKCKYCYISQLEAFGKIEKMQYPPEHVARSLSKERLGGVSLINLTGNGETLIQREIVQLTKLLLQEGHFVEIVTNGIMTERITEILDQPPKQLSHLFFKLSFHYKELKRLGIMDKFFSNVRKIHEAGASFTLELMAYDDIENDIEDIKKICIENAGAVCQATIGRNERKEGGLLSSHSKKEYFEIWKSLDSPMMKFKLQMLGVKRKEFCYAGAWSMFVNLYTGEAQACYWQPYNQNIFVDLDKPIRFDPVGHSCSQPFCINAHSHMTWGLIPELNAPTYDVMRNRLMKNGEEWLTFECKQFFQTKLQQSNKEFSALEKRLYDLAYPFRMLFWFCNDGKNNMLRIKKHIMRKMRWEKDGTK